MGEHGTAGRRIHAEQAGQLSAAEAAQLERREEFKQAEIDRAIAHRLITDPVCPDEYLCVYAAANGGPEDGERENAYLALRLKLAHALQWDTPANREAAGAAALNLVRMAMRDEALDQLGQGRGRSADSRCPGCGALGIASESACPNCAKSEPQHFWAVG